MICGYFILTLFVWLVEGVFGDTDEVKSVSVLEGDAITLENKDQFEVIRWYFNDIRIAQFDQDVRESCLYDGEDGRFRDRMKVDYETGSLIISNITTEHAGHYEADIIRQGQSGNHYSFHISRKCDNTKIIKKNLSVGDHTQKFTVTLNEYDKRLEKTSAINPGLSSAAVAGISAGGVGVVVLVAVAVAAAVIYHRRRSYRKDMERNNQEIL